MSPPSSHDALAALERLYAKQAISLEEGQTAARLISGDDAYVFPQPAAPKPAPEGAEDASAPAPAEPASTPGKPEAQTEGMSPE